MIKRLFEGEVVKDFDCYYLNLHINGEYVEGLPEYDSYTALKKAVKDRFNIQIPNLKDLKFDKQCRKSYAYFRFVK